MSLVESIQKQVEEALNSGVVGDMLDIVTDHEVKESTRIDAVKAIVDIGKYALAREKKGSGEKTIKFVLPATMIRGADPKHLIGEFTQPPVDDA